MVEFDMFSEPPVPADDRIQIDLFECGEKIADIGIAACSNLPACRIYEILTDLDRDLS
jgi:hypothetical protein